MMKVCGYLLPFVVSTLKWFTGFWHIFVIANNIEFLIIFYISHVLIFL